MIKTFNFILPEVAEFSRQVRAFSPKLPDSQQQRYEDAGIQLLEEYMDYHPVLFYRIQAHVQGEGALFIETRKGDHHLVYNLDSPEQILFQ